MGYCGKENKDQKGFGGGNHSRKMVLLKEQKGPTFIFGYRIRKASSRS